MEHGHDLNVSYCLKCISKMTCFQYACHNVNNSALREACLTGPDMQAAPSVAHGSGSTVCGELDTTKQKSYRKLWLNLSG